ncbi:MAG: rhomboid family intramembrane serine protease [Simkaniaceae bacterium]
MRQVASLSDEQEALKFQRVLIDQEIENELEPTIDSLTGQKRFTIWVKNEDKNESALKLYNEFIKDPSNPKYDIPLPSLKEEEGNEEEEKPSLDEDIPQHTQRPPKLTFLIIMVCTFFFILNISQKVEVAPFLKTNLVVLTPLEEAFFYDLPPPVQEISSFWKKIELGEKGEIPELSPAETAQLNELEKIPFWKGFYELILKWPSSKEMLKAPLFIKIREGEIYRIFTPALLHGGLLHILFNMLWVFLLGRMMEERLSRFRFLFLMILMAIVSNTVQYLMTGPFFLGYSGVVCGMAGFIWVRQKLAPWEGYPLEKLTALFLGIFIFGMLLFQIALFFVERFTAFNLNLQIANAAHVAGAITGMVLARIPYFYKSLN